ncbi:MAG TPA: hypothetical protein VGX92_17365 [Pyrinomonadaceae bacterium]|jgi:hypothetical protein|nr:hypothetical protein [Pyrinomonadaceae bacterium]
MKNNGAKSEETGGRMRNRALLESLRQFIAVRFALSSPHRSKNILRNADALARSRAFSREVIKNHGRLPVTDTFGFLNSLFGHGLMTEELPGYSASLIYREPGSILHQSFYNWFMEAVLSLTVNKLEQHFGIWLNHAYAIQTPSNLSNQSRLDHKSYLEHKSALEYRSYLERKASLENSYSVNRLDLVNQSYPEQSYPETAYYFENRSYQDNQSYSDNRFLLEHKSALEYRSYLENRSYPDTRFNPVNQSHLAARRRGQAVGRDVFFNQPALNRGALPERSAVSLMLESRLLEVYAKDAGLRFTQVFHLPLRQTIQLLMRTHLINTLRAFESRNRVGPESAGAIHATSPHAHYATSAYAHHVMSLQARYAMNVYAHAAARADEAGRESGISFLSIASSPSGIFVAPQQEGRGAGSAPTPQRDTSWEKNRPGVGRDGRADAPELTALPLSARGLAERIRAAYVAGPPGVSPASSHKAAFRKAYADGEVIVGAAEFVSLPPATTSDVERQPPASLHRVRSTRSVMVESARRWQGDGPAFSRLTIALTGIVDWLERKREAGLSYAKVEPARVGPTGSVLLKAVRSGESTDVNQKTSAPLSDRASAARTVSTNTTLLTAGTALTAGTGMSVGTMLTAGAYKPLTEGRGESSAESGFTFRRREEQMRPPPQSYAFAQPVHHALVEERVVNHVQEKDVNEMVRKEVATVLESRPAVDALSRADYSRIADHVYSSLARRLLIEKERSGLHR